MSSPLLSKLMKVTIDASTVACTQDFSLSINKDMIEISCMDSAGAKINSPDMYSWSVSGSGMVFRTAGSGYGIFEMANTLLSSDASVAVAIIPDVSANKYFTGAGFFTSISMEGGAGSPVSYSFEITGTGALTIGTTS